MPEGNMQAESELVQATLTNVFAFLHNPASFFEEAEKCLAIHADISLPASLEEMKNLAHEKGLV